MKRNFLNRSFALIFSFLVFAVSISQAESVSNSSDSNSLASDVSPSTPAAIAPSESDAARNKAGLPIGSVPLTPVILKRGRPPETPSSVVEFDLNSLQTSTSYHTDGLNLSYLRRAPKTRLNGFDFGASLSAANGRSDALRFTFSDLVFTSGYHWRLTKLSADLGVNSRTTDSDPMEQIFIGRLSLEKSWKAVNSKLTFGHDSFAQALQSDGSTRADLQGLFGHLNLSAQPYERWRANFTQKLIFLSDSNRRTDSDFSLMYGLSPGWPWIWFGAGYELLTDSGSDVSYWAPRVFRDVGPRLDVAFPLIGAFSAAAGFNFNWYTDLDFGSGTGYYASGKIIYGQTEGRHAYLGIEAIQSQQEASRWKSLNISSGVAWPF